MGRPKFKVCKEVPGEALEGPEPEEGRVEGGEGPQTAWNLQVEGGDGSSPGREEQSFIIFLKLHSSHTPHCSVFTAP